MLLKRVLKGRFDGESFFHHRAARVALSVKWKLQYGSDGRLPLENVDSSLYSLQLGLLQPILFIFS